MVLVAYSDSENSDGEETTQPVPVTKTIASAKPSTSNFTIDKGNPSKIRVNLASSLPEPSNDREDGEPAAKRARIGGGGSGAFSGFNAMLPAPKRDNLKPGATTTNGSKAPARKVFGLKTGAEPAFSRDSDAELRELFAEQEESADRDHESRSTIPNDIPKPQFPTEPNTSTTGGKPFMFKPLSVSRGPRKKKSASQIIKGSDQPVDKPTKTSGTTANQHTNDTDETILPPTSKQKQKMSLFSSGPVELPPDPDLETDPNPDDDEIVEILDEPPLSTPAVTAPSQQPESLTSIAASLNLTPAERRQLLGRNYNAASNNIISFNTDTEYATNQALNASAEAVQHNPVRAIGGGKHSLKSLVANAQGQKDALEESFASGRKNKREAGSKYGW